MKARIALITTTKEHARICARAKALQLSVSKYLLLLGRKDIAINGRRE